MATEFDPDLTEAEKREEKEAEAASDQEGSRGPCTSNSIIIANAHKEPAKFRVKKKIVRAETNSATRTAVGLGGGVDGVTLGVKHEKGAMKLAYKEEPTEEMELAPGKTHKFRLDPVIGVLTTPGQETQASNNLVVTIEIGSKVVTTECTRGHGIIIVEDATHEFFILQAFGRNGWGGRFNAWVDRDTKKNHFPQDLTNSG